MMITWIFLLLISYSMIEESCGANGQRHRLRTSAQWKKYGRSIYEFTKNSPTQMKRFMIWIYKHLRYGIRCVPYNDYATRCRTKGGLNKIIPYKYFNKLPGFVQRSLLHNPKHSK